MITRHSCARAVIAAGFALASLLAVAASAAVNPAPAPANVAAPATTQIDSQLFLFN
ncbi:hypothetical protein [Azospirillum sp. TSO35-2]|uniref:hypothetical protein n=1 Tax=Azospirillum sp. TSO35-2 TaxID=716796 RepID=UPI0013049AD2|nr:hypothetical protein [Azospirillum sp. TSO35-2]